MNPGWQGRRWMEFVIVGEGRPGEREQRCCQLNFEMRGDGGVEFGQDGVGIGVPNIRAGETVEIGVGDSDLAEDAKGASGIDRDVPELDGGPEPFPGKISGRIELRVMGAVAVNAIFRSVDGAEGVQCHQSLVTFRGLPSPQHISVRVALCHSVVGTRTVRECHVAQSNLVHEHERDVAISV